MTLDIAKALGHDIAEHCFSSKGKIRPEFTQYQFRLRLPRQRVTVEMATDASSPHAVLRQVLASSVVIQKRGELKPAAAVEKKSKKVAPQGETLRLVVALSLSVAEREHRDFLAQRFNDTLFFTFDDEEQSLPFEPVTEADQEVVAPLLEDPDFEDDAASRAAAREAEQAAKAEKKAKAAKPRLAKGARTKSGESAGA